MSAARDLPLVSIGLPVYNGAEFLDTTLASLELQTYPSVELIISDNASTDATEEICRRRAAGNPRIRYSRLPENIGGVPNHNRTVALASGVYFMWASHDDLWEPAYVETCVGLLERDPGAVLAYSRMAIIDDAGARQRVAEEIHTADSDDPVRRFWEFTDLYSMLEAFYGVVRKPALDRTRLLVRHPGNDRIVLSELALVGRFVQSPEILYLRRDHGQRWVNLFPDIGDRYAWVEPKLAGRRTFPHWGYLAGYAGAAARSTLSLRDKARCGLLLLGWIRDRRKELLRDLR
jgi:glycosyltransferase involved in cell wall biosynthesis